MDIYSTSKKAKHKKTNRKAKKGNFFVRIKDKFLAMSVAKRSTVIALIAILLVLVLIISFILGYIVKWSLAFNHDKEFQINNVEPISEDIVNIALFGLDTRNKNDFSGRSDSIMILSLDKEDGEVKVISVMRDSLVKVPNEKNTLCKINTAYSLGGPELAVKTLNSVFGLDITEYAAVNFFGMADIIDAVGGIEVNVLESERTATNGVNYNIRQQAKLLGKKPDYVEKAGKQTLSGIQAVAWARIRSVATEGGESNDFGRTDRQRYVMEQLLNKALNLSVSAYPGLVDKMLPYMKTSLSVSEIIDFSSIISKNVKFEETRIPHNKYIINAGFNVSGVGSSVYYNLDYASKVLCAYIYDDISPEDYMEQNGVDKTGWYGNSGYKPSGGGSQSSTSSTVVNTSSEIEASSEQQTSSEPSTESSEGQGTVSNVSSEFVTSDTPSEEVGGEEMPVESENDTPSEEQGGTEEPTESEAELPTEPDTQE